jgi:hypothetical protein
VTLPLAVLVLVAPALLLLSAVVALAAHGPLGWLAAAGLLAVVAVVSHRTCRACWTWWLGTKAPVRDPLARPRTRDWERPGR